MTYWNLKRNGGDKYPLTVKGGIIGDISLPILSTLRLYAALFTLPFLIGNIL